MREQRGTHFKEKQTSLPKTATILPRRRGGCPYPPTILNTGGGGVFMASGQTTNYGLNQWTSEDAVLREEFNRDNKKIDELLPRIVVGNYVGTGEENVTKHYSLGSRPKLVFLRTEITYSSNTYDIGLILTDTAIIYCNSNSSYMRAPGQPAGLEDDGFFINHGASSELGLNREGVVQHYWAWC